MSQVDELAATLTPLLRGAMERAKPDLLGTLPPIQRTALRLLWGVILARFVPAVAGVAARILVDWLSKADNPPLQDAASVSAFIRALEVELGKT